MPGPLFDLLTLFLLMLNFLHELHRCPEQANSRVEGLSSHAVLWPFQEGEDKIFLINKLHSVYEGEQSR